MTQLTIQILQDTAWIDAATLTLIEPKRGSASACKLGYMMDYALDWLEHDDEHACSIELPVQLMIEHESKQCRHYETPLKNYQASKADYHNVACRNAF